MKGAVDLNQHMADKATQKAADEQARMAAAVAHAEAWEKAMHRTFKGIIGGTRAQRRRALMASARKLEQADA